MLLGSPPDMVHRGPLRGTGASTPLTWGRRHIVYPLVGIHPCYSGLQVTGHRWLPDWCSLAKGRGSILLQKLILINIDFNSLQIRKMCYNVQALGPVAQLGERSVRIREVESSSLFRSTTTNKSEPCAGWQWVRIYSYHERGHSIRKTLYAIFLTA